jgi:DNA-binding CsgD family transcriptional regulator
MEDAAQQGRARRALVARHTKREPDAPDPAVLERQIRCYDLRLRGYTHAQIAAAVSIHRDTVAIDIGMESQRRQKERESLREDQVEVQAQRFENVLARVNARQAKLDALATAETQRPGGGNWRREMALRHLIVADERHIVTANDKLAEVLGLKAPVKVEVEHTGGRAAALLDAFAAASAEQRATLYAVAHTARERLRNVTPP